MKKKTQHAHVFASKATNFAEICVVVVVILRFVWKASYATVAATMQYKQLILTFFAVSFFFVFWPATTSKIHKNKHKKDRNHTFYNMSLSIFLCVPTFIIITCIAWHHTKFYLVATPEFLCNHRCGKICVYHRLTSTTSFI